MNMKQVDKYKKEILIPILTICLFGFVRFGSAYGYDSALMEYIKKEKFNLELYELSFCTEEVLKIIESDSTYQNDFIKRINRAFDKRLSESQRYFHTFEYVFFLNQISTIKNYKIIYPKSLLIIENLQPLKRDYTFKNYSFPFQNYIEYPEQVDDACIISLITDLPSTVWSDIERDKLALYRFNAWLEFGFEEFRYYPGTKSKVKSTLNKRIVDYISSKHKNSSMPLIVKALKSINHTVEKYNK
ncbi:hypothetical protein SanaruYs_35660 [Chryseotalea sanaruensis]|uniref:Uncharacterized protein n=2 Tax=Chryseotalea sanaruensis TaxID=2482724 RepID=A0A401UEK1_9BACT|nr:hypothetical protein SanaruYs_35660 [Chryseotalea sanaruensis]